MPLPILSFKSIATQPNIASPTKQISSLFHYQEPNNSRHEQDGTKPAPNCSGQIIVAAKSSKSTCRLFYYSVKKAQSEVSSDKETDYSLARTRFVVFPKPIETLILLNAPSANGICRIPTLIVFCRDGNMYKSDSLVDTPDQVSMIKCKRDIVGTVRNGNGTNGQESYNQPFVGMNLVNVQNLLLEGCMSERHVQQKESTMEKETILLVAGISTLAAPMIVVLPSTCNETFQTVEMKGLENTSCSISAMNIFNERALDFHTRKRLQYVWKSKVSQCPQPNWDASHLSVALIGFSDGSIYATYVLVTSESGTKNIEVSRAAKIYESSFPLQRIISFCLVPDMVSNGSILICVGSQGCMMILSGTSAGESLQVVIPEPLSAAANCQEKIHNQSTSCMGLITQAESFPLSFEDEEISSNKMPSMSMIVTAKNGSTYILGLKKSGDTFSGYFFPSPLRKDIGAVVTCFVPSSDSQQKGITTNILLTSITYRRSMHLFIASEATFKDAIDGMTLHGEESSKVDDLLKNLAELDASSKNIGFTINGKDSMAIAIASVRYTADLISPLCDKASSMAYRHDPNDINHIEVSIDCDNTRKNQEYNASTAQSSRSTHFSQSVAASKNSFPPSIHSLKVLGSQIYKNEEVPRSIPILHGGVAQSYSIGDCHRNSHEWNTFAWNLHTRTIFASSTISLMNTPRNKKRRRAGGINPPHMNHLEEASYYKPDSFSAAIRNKRRPGLQSVELALFESLKQTPFNNTHNSSGVAKFLEPLPVGSEIGPRLKERCDLKIGHSNRSNNLVLPLNNFERALMTFSYVNDKRQMFETEGTGLNTITVTDRAQHDHNAANEIALIMPAYTKQSLSVGTSSENDGKSFDLKKSIKYLKKVKERLANENSDVKIYLEAHKKLRSLPFSKV